ncbi:T9SS type A sorting domain-containing protein [Spirosoma sp. BT702]|uniref:T9SS type A sorting domain-containing protein n=1 Tax=Spirosoma profusum TaxID=2771354 RepID=A0A926XW29_9BACT|nr:T9SS type A sorting domain-containing protein [Spirosoma profusum]MBD2700861.1 T9SS type A sorting domain-containing protein [Spirosoma profusum]
MMTTSATYTPTAIGPVVSSVCNTPFSREVGKDVAEIESGNVLLAIAFPNPADHAITVRVNPAGQETQLRLLIRQQALMPANVSDKVLSFTSLPSGAYLIEVVRGNQRKVISIRKQ